MEQQEHQQRSSAEQAAVEQKNNLSDLPDAVKDLMTKGLLPTRTRQFRKSKRHHQFPAGWRKLSVLTVLI
jgi:hypothetical protein